jgi:small redox-active disulfide protein 2
MRKIEILGMGCAKCNELEARAKKAVEELKIEAEVKKVTDMKVISGYGVFVTPAIAIDGVVKAAGRVVSVDEIKEWLK